MSRVPHTSRKDGKIIYSFWLIFNVDGGVRITRNQPDLAAPSGACA